MHQISPTRFDTPHSMSTRFSKGPARRSPRRAAHEVRVGHKPQDREGSRLDDPAVAAAAGGSDNRVMNRRAFIATLTGGLLSTPLGVEAQRTGTSRRLCFLTFDSRATHLNKLSFSRASPVQFDPFFQRLRDLGYLDGRTITINHLSADGQGARFPALAADCLRLKADIIVVTTTPAPQAAKKVTRTIPIVMIPLGDPVSTGLVATLARPGGTSRG